jgi:hypothetical protein
MLDLNDIATADQTTLDLLHPVTRAPLGATVILAGPEHPIRRQAVFARQRKARAAMQKAGRVVLGDPEDDESEAVVHLAACTLGWNGITRDGKPVDFTPGAAVQIYGDPRLAWLRDQVQAALDSRDLFITGSAKP